MVQSEGLEVLEVGSDEERLAVVIQFASSILEQDRYLVGNYSHAVASCVVGAGVSLSFGAAE